MIISVDSASSVPMYAQIVEQVKRGIASGSLRKGETLPSRRELAVRLEINPLTVLKAYKDLEAEGMITIRQGLGCFVTAEPEQATESYRIESIAGAIDRLVEDALEFGVPLERLETMLRERMQLAESEERERMESENGD